MLGESREQEDAAERRRLRRSLLTLAYPPSLLRWRPDVAARQFDRLISGPEPRPSRWNPYSGLQRLAWRFWRCLTLLQERRRSVNAA